MATKPPTSSTFGFMDQGLPLVSSPQKTAAGETLVNFHHSMKKNLRKHAETHPVRP